LLIRLVFVWAAVLRPRRAIKSLMTYWQLCGPGFDEDANEMPG
jgi:hypothetical protein